MPGIADLILKQMATAGQPRIAKETSTVTAPGEGLDIGSIIMMLMMSQMFKGKGPATGPGLPIAPPMGGPALDTGLLGMGGGGLPGPMAGPGPDLGMGGGSGDILGLLTSLIGGGGANPMPIPGASPAGMNRPIPGGGIPNVGVPTPPAPAPTDISAGIPLQAPQNLQDLMMIVDLLSKMDTNPYG